MHKDQDPLQRQSAELPTLAQLRAVQRRNAQFALQRGALGLDKLSLAHIAVDTSVGEGKRPRSPQDDVKRAIERARFLVDALQESEGQMPEDRLEDALETLKELGNVPLDHQGEVKRLVEALEDALRPAAPLPSPPRASQADRLAVRSELLRANEALRQLEPVSRVDGLDDGAIGQLVERLEQQRERLRDAAQRVAGDSDLVDEIESTDLRLRSVVYLLESLVESRPQKEPNDLPGSSVVEATPARETDGDDEQQNGERDDRQEGEAEVEGLDGEQPLEEEPSVIDAEPDETSSVDPGDVGDQVAEDSVQQPVERLVDDADGASQPRPVQQSSDVAGGDSGASQSQDGPAQQQHGGAVDPRASLPQDDAMDEEPIAERDGGGAESLRGQGVVVHDFLVHWPASKRPKRRARTEWREEAQMRDGGELQTAFELIPPKYHPYVEATTPTGAAGWSRLTTSRARSVVASTE
jgi:hypothetical protein